MLWLCYKFSQFTLCWREILLLNFYALRVKTFKYGTSKANYSLNLTTADSKMKVIKCIWEGDSFAMLLPVCKWNLHLLPSLLVLGKDLLLVFKDVSVVKSGEFQVKFNMNWVHLCTVKHAPHLVCLWESDPGQSSNCCQEAYSPSPWEIWLSKEILALLFTNSLFW